jgi:hypothetical protein
MFKVNLGTHRGKYYKNFGDNYKIKIPAKALPDGTMVTIREKHRDFNWVSVNEDADDNLYPLDLLTPINKSGYILRLLKCL